MSTRPRASADIELREAIAELLVASLSVIAALTRISDVVATTGSTSSRARVARAKPEAPRSSSSSEEIRAPHSSSGVQLPATRRPRATKGVLQDALQAADKRFPEPTEPEVTAF